MKYQKITKHEALIIAKQLLGQVAPKSVKNTPQKTPILPNPVTVPTPTNINKTIILEKYYQITITSIQRSKKGKEYAEARNLNHETIQSSREYKERQNKWMFHFT